MYVGLTVRRKYPKGFSECKPKAASEARSSVFAEGLAEDAAEGLLEKNPEWYFQSTPLGTNLELEGLPEGTDSPYYTRGFLTDCHSNKISTANKQNRMKVPSVNMSPRVECGKTAGKTRVNVTQFDPKLHCRDFVRMIRLWFSISAI